MTADLDLVARTGLVVLAWLLGGIISAYILYAVGIYVGNKISVIPIEVGGFGGGGSNCTLYYQGERNREVNELTYIFGGVMTVVIVFILLIIFLGYVGMELGVDPIPKGG